MKKRRKRHSGKGCSARVGWEIREEKMEDKGKDELRERTERQKRINEKKLINDYISKSKKVNKETNKNK